MLEVRDLTVRFGDTVAVDGLSLSVGGGEVVTVLGPSGSGKSSLLRAIAGLEPVVSGSITQDGVDLGGVPIHERELGLMFQDHALFPHRDVLGNVIFGLRMQRRPPSEIDVRARRALELVGLSALTGRRIHGLSGGEQQRVALARALAPEPRLLMLDEPLGSLDRTLRDRLVVELRELFTTLGITAVYVTHDQAEAFSVADQVVVMRAGRVVQDGTPTEVWRRPADGFVARLLGLSNLVDVKVAGGVAATPWGPVAVPDAADGPATALIRPSALCAGVGGGPVTGRVTRRVFRGDHVEISVATDAGPNLAVTMPPERAPAVDERLALALAPGALELLGQQGPTPTLRSPPGSDAA